LGKVLRERRGALGIREVADDIGVSPATLSRVERGKLPDLNTFSMICKWLRVDPSEVLGTKKVLGKHLADSSSSQRQITAAHLRADAALSPEAASDLAELILAAHRATSEGKW
jgi:transcriptional regulator with XRE-family HTH domain